MSKRNTYQSMAISIRTCFLILAAGVVLFPLDAGAIDVVQRHEWQNTIEAQGSFNYARRGIFRDLYGNGVTFAIRYERTLSDKFGLGIRVSRVQLSNAEDYAIQKIKYRDLAFAPLLSYTLMKTRNMRLFSALGSGLSFRKVTLDSFTIDEYGDPQTAFEVSQAETTLYGLVMLGADIRLSRSLFLGARLTYDRHFFGDVTTGSFGDTGGFNFGGCFGIGF